MENTLYVKQGMTTFWRVWYRWGTSWHERRPPKLTIPGAPGWHVPFPYPQRLLSRTPAMVPSVTTASPTTYLSWPGGEGHHGGRKSPSSSCSELLPWDLEREHIPPILRAWEEGDAAYLGGAHHLPYLGLPYTTHLWLATCSLVTIHPSPFGDSITSYFKYFSSRLVTIITAFWHYLAGLQRKERHTQLVFQP